LSAEYPTPTTGPYGEIEIWKHDRKYPDNHGFDCAVGSCVLASAIPGGPGLLEWKKVFRPSGEQKKRQAVAYL